MRKINNKVEIENIISFIREKFQEAGKTKAVIGLSGGIDSSVSAVLTQKALGEDNILGLMLPYKKSHPDSLNHAQILIEKFSIPNKIIDISPMIDAYFDNYEPNASKLRIGNRAARERMCVLYDYSAKIDALVVGTGNKSELYVGYLTQFGDGACAMEPIGHLYKTEVRRIANELRIPHEIIDKKPTADLWEGQTDEKEMGISYRKLDAILHQLIDLKKDIDSIELESITKKEIKRVRNMIMKSAFKRELPDIPKLSEENYKC